MIDYIPEEFDRGKYTEVRIIAKKSGVEIGKVIAICEKKNAEPGVREDRGVGVNEEYQGDGVGTQLRSLLEKTIKDLGGTKITCVVNKKNDGSYRFHKDKVGFEDSHEDRKFWYLKKEL